MYIRIKRLTDIILSLIGIITLAPLFFIITIGIKLDSEGPVLFKQRRVGINKSEFNILKFRTMSVGTPSDVPTHLLNNSKQYITRMGKLLRKTSLDELPQLWNILIGSMSVVGPRPALWNQYDLIAARDASGANDVRPGLTGWAQVNGRDELGIDVKAALDGEYTANMGLFMDAKCLFLTLVNVLQGRGVVEGGTGRQDVLDETHPSDSE